MDNSSPCLVKKHNSSIQYSLKLLVWPLNLLGIMTLYLPIYTCHFLFCLISRSDSLDALYTQHSGTVCVYGGESQCVCVRVKSLYHTQGSEKKASALPHAGIQYKRFCEGGLVSNMFSVTLRTWALQCKQCLKFDLICMATITWPWLMSVLLPRTLSVPEPPLSPGLQLNPWCLALVGMVTRQGRERAVIPRWKVG